MGSMQILLVEPDVALAQIYRDALEAAGHEVDVVTSAQAAIFAADQHRPDVVVLELQLAAHNGVEFLYEFRSYPEWQTVPVIVNSVVPPGDVVLEVLWDQLRISAYHYKPRTKLSALVQSAQDHAAAKV